jgi:hypothetical protein
MGGAIFNQGALTLSAVTLVGNTARGGSATAAFGFGGGGIGEDAPISNSGGGFGGSLGASFGGLGGVASCSHGGSPSGGGGGGGFVTGSNAVFGGQ